MTTQSITCSLEGASCAGCVNKIERHLDALDGVILARGNASLKRMRVVWNSDTLDENALIKAVQSIGYDAKPIDLKNDQPSARSLLPHLALAGFGTMNIMAFSVSVWAGVVTDMGPNTLQFMHVLSAIIAFPVVIYSGAIFTGPALRALRARRTTMDTPISLAIWVTFVASLVETMRGAEQVYFDAVVSLIFLLLIGRVLEQGLQKRSGDASTNLRSLMKLSAKRLTPSDELEQVDADRLSSGDIIIVEAGERVPADAVLLSDHGEIDESVITGETIPRPLIKGANVIAGGILTAGPVRLRVTHVGDDAQIGRITQLVADVAAHKGALQKLADRFATSYVPMVLIGGVIGFVMWYFYFGAPFGDALMISVAVLVVTCPCAAGLATPAVTSRAAALLLDSGVVVKSGDALERLGDVAQVFADKTGTLSSPTLQLSDQNDDAALRAAAALAAHSHHPLAQVLAAAYPVAVTGDVTEFAGQGIKAQNGARLGSAEFTGQIANDIDGPSIWYRPAGGIATQIRFSEQPRDGVAGFVDQLQAFNIPITVLSGDRPAQVADFAKLIGAQDWNGGQSPENKLAILQAAKGGKTLMFGDGINDAPALSAAYVSASFSGASEIAQVAADIVLTRPDPTILSNAIAISRRARRLIVQNLWFSAAYNVVAVPLALAGFLTPAIAALLMSSSSAIVLANGFRLRAPA